MLRRMPLERSLSALEQPLRPESGQRLPCSMGPEVDNHDLFAEMGRGFLMLEKFEGGARRALCARRIALTALMAGGTMLLAIVLGRSPGLSEVKECVADLRWRQT